MPFVDSLLASVVVELESVGMELPYDEKTMENFRNLTSFDFETAYEDEVPLPEEDKGYRDDSMKIYKLEMDEDDIELVMDRIGVVKSAENLNEGKAFRLLIETGAGIVEETDGVDMG